MVCIGKGVGLHPLPKQLKLTPKANAGDRVSCIANYQLCALPIMTALACMQLQEV